MPSPMTLGSPRILGKKRSQFFILENFCFPIPDAKHVIMGDIYL